MLLRAGCAGDVQRASERQEPEGEVLILNLGCGDPNERSWHPIDGAINRDPGYDGWRFEHGLGEYADGSVDGVTISHALMYLPLDNWPKFMADVARVLRDGAVVRITEDDTADTRSRTHGRGWRGSQPAVTLTHPEMVKAHLTAAGLVAYDCGPDETMFENGILMQQQHGDAPHCFWVEGVRMTRVLFEPHADDAALFASFTVLRYRPMVVTCFPSPPDYGDTLLRWKETRDAMDVLGGGPCEQWAGVDLVGQMRALDQRVKPSLVFAPNVKASHLEHVAVAEAAREVFGDLVRTYHTYDANGKVRDGRQAEFEPVWIGQKLRALARYETQIAHPRAHAFFLADLREYIE